MKNAKHLMIAMLAAAAMLTTTPQIAQAGPGHDHGKEQKKNAKAEHGPKMDKKAKKVWDRSIKASMGDKADEKWIQNVKSVGTMSMPAQNMSIEMTLLLAPEKGMYLDLVIPGMGSFLQGVSGDIAWSNSMMEGPKILDGAQAEQMLKQSDLFANLHWENYYSSITYKDEQTVTMPDGTEVKAHALELTDLDTEAVTTNYYDSKTDLLIKTDALTAGPGGAMIPSTSYMTDYRDIDGYMTPFKTIMSTGPMEMIIEMKSIEINADLDDDTFDLPEEIKELLED